MQAEKGLNTNHICPWGKHSIAIGKSGFLSQSLLHEALPRGESFTALWQLVPAAEARPPGSSSGCQAAPPVWVTPSCPGCLPERCCDKRTVTRDPGKTPNQGSRGRCVPPSPLTWASVSSHLTCGFYLILLLPLGVPSMFVDFHTREGLKELQRFMDLLLVTQEVHGRTGKAQLSPPCPPLEPALVILGGPQVHVPLRNPQGTARASARVRFHTQRWHFCVCPGCFVTG